jgi:hypothetical protein
MQILATMNRNDDGKTLEESLFAKVGTLFSIALLSSPA